MPYHPIAHGTSLTQASTGFASATPVRPLGGIRMKSPLRRRTHAPTGSPPASLMKPNSRRCTIRNSLAGGGRLRSQWCIECPLRPVTTEQRMGGSENASTRDSPSSTSRRSPASRYTSFDTAARTTLYAAGDEHRAAPMTTTIQFEVMPDWAPAAPAFTTSARTTGYVFRVARGPCSAGHRF